MPIIETGEDANLFVAYLAARDNPRQIMANGVYPSALVALSAYDDLVSKLQPGGVYADYGEFHANITAAVTPYVTIMYQAMQTIVQTMQAIERAAPNTFGIQLPPEEEPTDE